MLRYKQRGIITQKRDLMKKTCLILTFRFVNLYLLLRKLVEILLMCRNSGVRDMYQNEDKDPKHSELVFPSETGRKKRSLVRYKYSSLKQPTCLKIQKQKLKSSTAASNSAPKSAPFSSNFLK